MKKINNPVRLAILTACVLLIAPSFAYSEDSPLKSMASSSDSGSSSGGHSKMTPEQLAERQEAKKAKQASKAYKRVKDKTWDELSKREKKYAVKNGIADEATYDAWKGQQKEVEEAKVAAKKAAKLAKENAKAYKRVKNKEWNELTNKELNYATKHGIDSKEKYDAWKAEQAAAASPLHKVNSTVPVDESKGLVTTPETRTPSSVK